jgi:uncharacterized membrane protein YphA (DoxX/SURF4 family)
MKINPFYDTWEFLLGRTGDHMLAGAFVSWILTLGFLALLAAGVRIAWQEWHADPAQQTTRNLAIWAMRTLLGCMWFQGSLWKLPLPVSGGLSYWTQQMSEHSAFAAHAWLVKSVLLPGLIVFNPIVYLVELGMGIAFILGLAVRPFAVIGSLFVLNLWIGLYRHPQEWPWTYFFLIFTMGFFYLDNVGRLLGLDGMMARKPIALLRGDGVIARLYRRLT